MSLQTANHRFLSGVGNAALRFERNRTVRAITDGLINLIPLVLIGAICLAISNLPIKALHDVLNGITLGHWSLIANIITFSTEDIIALGALISVALSLSSQSRFLQRQELSVFIPMFTAFACYVILFVWDASLYNATPEGQSPEALFTNPGRNGVFGALFTALVSVRLFEVFSRLWQKLPWSHWKIIGSHQQIRTAIRSSIPMLGTLVCFIALRLSLDGIFNNTQIEEQLIAVATNIATDGSLSGVIASVLMMQILWFFGAHGSNTIQTLMEQATANGSLASAAETIDPASMFSNPDFYSVFVDMGGTGTGIALLLALAVFGSVGRGKSLAKISIFPVAFNINETLLFGVPIVLSPFSVIPFITAPVVVATVAYGALSLGIVPPMVNFVEWTTPILFSGYMSTGSIAGSLLQLVCVGLAFLIYSPFIVGARTALENYQLRIYERFKTEAVCAANNEQTLLINRKDAIGDMARDFVTELHMFFDDKNIPFHMVFQPKVDAQGRVVGAEALLRGDHPRYGPVPPDILIELTDEADLSTILGRWIATQSFEQLAAWRQRGLDQLTLSFNLNPHHLYEDNEFPDFLKSEMQRLSIDPSFIELEITEHIAVRASSTMLKMFQRLRELGVELSIDDMGMGYSSLTYISDFGVEVVKLDISLIDKVVEDTQQQEIVKSVLELAQQIDLAVVVEGVETRRQVDALEALGCRYFQGYYFSKPLSPEEFVAFAQKQGTARLEHEGAGERKEPMKN